MAAGRFGLLMAARLRGVMGRSGPRDLRLNRPLRSTPLPWLAGLLGGYLLVPLVLFAGRAASTPTAPGPGLGGALAVSVETATIATAVIALLGIPLAYLLAKARGRLAGILQVLVQLPLALPPLMSGIVLLYLVGPATPLGRLFGGHLTDNRVGIVLAQVFVAAPFLVAAARAGFAGVDPALPDVAATLGHGPWRRFIGVAVPAALPAIAAGLLLSWLRAFGEFGATVVLAYHPYSLPVYTYVEFGASGLAATLAPVAAGLGTAVVLLVLATVLPRARQRRAVHVALPLPRPPAPRRPSQLSFDVVVQAGAFTVTAAHAAAGRNVALLGPSGAGKTLALRALAGLTGGFTRVRVDGADISAVPPERRGFGYVPQDAALLPHLPVWRQVTFGATADPALAAHWLHRLGIDGLADRLPGELSGGQRRRVAIARALATDPAVVLLDEPFAGLDAPVRDDLRRELRQLQREGTFTTVLVTHDAADAALLADEVLVLADGRLLQAGPTGSVLCRPVSPLVARLLGARNVVRGRVTDDGRIQAGAVVLDVAVDAPAGTAVTWQIAPDDVRLSPEGRHAARVVDRWRHVDHDELLLVVGDVELTARVGSGRHPHLRVGSPCRVDLPAEAARVWPDAQSLVTRTAVP